METIRRLITRFSKWEYAGLLVLVLVTLVLHFSVIMAPDEPLFDEQHYIPDARLIIDGEGTERPEHPPLGKLFIVAGIKLFGDNPFGWRFFSVLLGTICVILFYLICRRLNLSKRVSFLATFLLALENLSFVQAAIAMLDVYSLVFAMAAFWLYLKGKYVMSGVAVGLSALAKLSGALAIVIGLHWFLVERRRPWRFLPSMLAAPVSFLLLMPLFDYAIWHKWFNPVAQVDNMLRLTGSIVFSGVDPGVGSRPWEWVLFPEVMPYWWQSYYTGMTGEILPNWWLSSYIGMISPTLWVFIIPVVIYITFRAIKGNTPVLFPFSWFIGCYLLWIPASLITDRVTYIFYFYHVVGAIAIGLALVLFRLLEIASAREPGKLRWLIRLGVPIYLLLHIIAFIVLAPMSLWWSVPLCLLLYIFTLRFLGFSRRLEVPPTLIDVQQVNKVS